MHPLDQLHTVRGVPFSSTPGPSGRQENIARVGRVTNHSNNRMTTAGFFDGGNRTHRATKRGRPRADLINALIVEGSASAARIRCKLCSRVFPREKSLQAHMRTHTGERPYTCDFPGCRKAFCQSGQLKTHQRLHTGEKPFICSVEGCKSRFTHANRHCSQHPYATLRRVETQVPVSAENSWEHSENAAVLQWLQKQAARRQNRPVKEQSHILQRNHSEDCGDFEEMSDEDSISSSQNSQLDVPETVPYMIQDQHDKWISAMALIELARGCGSA